MSDGMNDFVAPLPYRPERHRYPPIIARLYRNPIGVTSVEVYAKNRYHTKLEGSLKALGMRVSHHTVGKCGTTGFLTVNAQCAGDMLAGVVRRLRCRGHAIKVVEPRIAPVPVALRRNRG